MKTPADWQRVREVFHRALELPPDERAEFLRQNALLANMWTGLGATTASVEEPDRHHYSVIEGLEDASHPLTRTLLAKP